MIFDGLFNRRQLRTAHSLYREAAASARRRELYLDCGVPDTVDGRFDMVVLHAFLLLRRLRREDRPGIRLGQGLFDVMFDHFVVVQGGRVRQTCIPGQRRNSTELRPLRLQLRPTYSEMHDRALDFGILRDERYQRIKEHGQLTLWIHPHSVHMLERHLLHWRRIKGKQNSVLEELTC